jgi:glutaredoxin 3
LNGIIITARMTVNINKHCFIMPKILIYTTDICPYCIMAKRLLDKKGTRYTEINVDAKPGLREAMMQKTQRRTVPQIYIGDLHVGGFDELYALEQQKKLDTLLTATCQKAMPL